GSMPGKQPMYGSNDNERTVPNGKAKMVQRATAEQPGERDAEPEQAAEPTIEAPPSHVPAPNISDQRVYLAVPFDEKDDAKEIGARWDGRSKAWYVPPGTDLAPFTSWLPAQNSVQIAVDANPVEQFAEALRESGLRLDGPPVMDGQLHRVAVEGDRGKQRSGTYSGHLDGSPAGFIQNFKTGTRTNWKATGQAAALGAH